ncbi:DUF5994 family protein [Nocardia sp. CDC159]|uniref:DUF5994 family protein n=1 Tax=Nocardia pulmonis TaxID=2951408 RepID=A0A9X2EIZ5_9NOCA|nr:MULTISPECIES: DUF5994 family protein [Nocardia]MCM6779011.1 DUF5994 family protein [Nocardia pulmonis]MCM6791893.1 DUF5994 family protein [Nocardia sp. CDC159]
MQPLEVVSSADSNESGRFAAEAGTSTMKRRENRSDTEPNGPPADRTPRVLLKASGLKTGYVDGAWWPYADDLAAELPALLPILETRVGAIHRVTYRLDEWPDTPGVLAFAGRAVRLDGYRGGTVHTIEVLGARNHRLVLLVVPPYTDAHHAFTAMASASGADNEATVDDLLMVGMRERTARTDRATAVQQWKYRTPLRTSPLPIPADRTATKNRIGDDC